MNIVFKMKLLALLLLTVFSTVISMSTQAQYPSPPTKICPTTPSGQIDYSQGCVEIDSNGRGHQLSPSGQREKSISQIIGNDIYEVSPSGQINKKIGQVK